MTALVRTVTALATAALLTATAMAHAEGSDLPVAEACRAVSLVDMASGRVQRLFDDPEGALVSGASTAAAYGPWLLIGSAIGSGLIICHLTAELLVSTP